MERIPLFLGLCIIMFIPQVIAENPDYIPDPGTIILSSVPDVRQSQDYSCGAAALQAVLNYWGTDSREGELIDLMNTTPESGTTPEAIVTAASSFGYQVTMKENLTLKDLKESISSKVPVIIAAQAWNGEYVNGTWVSIPTDWSSQWADGHYMVVIGVDSRNVYLEDPAMLGTRGVIPADEFLERWHDSSGDTKSAPEIIYNHLGIFIKGNNPVSYPAYTRVT